MRLKTLLPFAAVFTAFHLNASAAPESAEAIEIHSGNTGLLPGGKEADGIIGDFLLHNDRVEAVISHNSELRRANMSTFYGDDGMTPGCLYDLAIKGTDNDQITVFAPLKQRGKVSLVRIANDGSDGKAAVVECVTTAALGKGVYRKHEYILEKGWDGVLIKTTLRNESDAAVPVPYSDTWTVFRSAGSGGGVWWADAIDPADKAGYAFGWVDEQGAVMPPEKTDLGPGEEITVARFLAVGTSPAEARGKVLARRGETGTFSGKMAEAGAKGFGTGRILFKGDGKLPPIYPDDDGAFSVQLSPGKYAIQFDDIGRRPVERDIEIKAGEKVEVSATMEDASAVRFVITDADSGKPIPCKVQFHGIKGTKSPDLGPHDRAHGCADQYHSEKGEFQVQVPPGQYGIVVTRGIEYSHHAEHVDVPAGRTIEIKAQLKRLVDTKGWISADFHNHSTPSGDNTCGTDDRIINLAAEQIEYAPTTEHNRLYDWTPHIEKLGLAAEMSTVPGMELTGRGAHFNAFPFKPVPFRQDGGAPVWNKDPRINAITLRHFQGDEPQRWIQINHPDMMQLFGDRDGDGLADGGYFQLGPMLDGVETQNYRDSNILAKEPYSIARTNGVANTVSWRREFVWLQLLNQGHKIWGVGVCDAHRVYGNGVGGWRTYLPSSTDDPAKIDWKEIGQAAKTGQMVLTTGPFLEVTADDGIIAGGDIKASDSIDLKVKVQCTDWIDIDRIQVMVNSRQPQELNFTRETHPDWFQDGVVKFDRKITVPLKEDSHLIVVAYGAKSDLSTGYGSSAQSKIHPCAYNNPIFVDTDGNGFKANGDTLGFPLPAKVSVDQARELLDAASGEGEG